MEKRWLSKTINLINKEYESTNDLQTALYDVVKEDIVDENQLKQAHKRYFQILYNMLLGNDKGPKLGLFLMVLDNKIIGKLL